jgi:hypothetical protein
MFLWLDVSRVAELRDGTECWLQWPSGASVGAYGTRYGIELRYCRNDDEIRQPVILDHLPCNFGGTRSLLRCPRCDRRCRKLYLYGRWFVCRVCTRAPYWTQTASPDARMVSRIRKLQARLAPHDDPDDYVTEWVPRRPKGMRRVTYRRLVERLERVNDKRDAYLEPGLLRVLGRFMTDDDLAAILKLPT